MKDIKSVVFDAADEILGLPQDEMEDQMDLDLFENGLIDSLGCVAMIDYISSELSCRIDMENMEPEDYESLNSIIAAVERITGR